MGCPDHALDFSKGLFEHFADLGAGVLTGNWWFNDGSNNGGGQQQQPEPTTTTKTKTATKAKAAATKSACARRVWAVLRVSFPSFLRPQRHQAHR